MEKLRVALLFGGVSSEHEVSCVSASTILEHLDPDIVIHRVTGDGPKDLLIAPLWASRKREVLNLLHHRMKERGSFQGKAL